MVPVLRLKRRGDCHLYVNRDETDSLTKFIVTSFKSKETKEHYLNATNIKQYTNKKIDIPRRFWNTVKAKQRVK